jgi:hypothetical protein
MTRIAMADRSPWVMGPGSPTLIARARLRVPPRRRPRHLAQDKPDHDDGNRTDEHGQ